MQQPIPSRRQFLAAIGELASAGWIAMNWPQIALAAEHANHAADDDAIANQIVGARDARVIRAAAARQRDLGPVLS